MKRLTKLSQIDKNIPLKDKLTQLKDIGEHKIYMLKCCNLLAAYLFENQMEDIALELMKRGFSHDMSKLSDEEFYGMAKFANDMDALKDPKKQISSEKEIYINMHRDNNKHHPEFWDDITEMTTLDIMELCCDWCARSEQFKTDVIEFLQTRQKTQFNFPENIYREIEKYLLIIVDQIKKES